MLSTIGGSVTEKPLSVNAEQRPLVAAALATPSSVAKLAKISAAKDSPKRLELVRLELLGIVQVRLVQSSTR